MDRQRQQPSKSERRIEIVSVLIQYREEGKVKHIGETREIERRSNGKVSGLKPMGGPLGGKEGDQLRGRFTHLLAARRPTAADREIAKLFLDALGNIEEFGRINKN